MSKTSGLQIIAECLVVWWQCPSTWPVGFLSFPSSRPFKRWCLTHVLAYVAFLRGREVDRSLIGPKDTFVLYPWIPGEFIGFAKKPVPEWKWEIDGQFVYQKRWLPDIAIHFKAGVRLRSIEDHITATWKTLFGEQPHMFPMEL